MAIESAYSGDDPHRLLSSARELAQRVRRAQRATWFPLLVFAAVTFAAIPVSRYGGHHPENCAAVPGGRICTIYSTASFVYWPIALVLAYVAIAAFYIHRSRAQGVGTRVPPYVIAGIIVAALATGLSLWWVHASPTSPYGQLLGMGVLGRLVSKGAAIGVALLVLAWAERNRALLLLTLGYLAAVLVPINFGWVLDSSWYFLPPLVIDGSVLLLGGIGFAVARRPSRLPAA
jgi:hypothetical protein